MNNKTEADKTEEQERDDVMAAKSDDGNVCLVIIKNKQGQDHVMVNLEMEASGGESRRPSGSGQSSYIGENEQNKPPSKQNKIDPSKLMRVIIQNEIGAGAFNIPPPLRLNVKIQDIRFESVS